MNEEDLAKVHWRMGPGVLYRHSLDGRRRELVRITTTADYDGEKFMIRQSDAGTVIREAQRRKLTDAVALGEEWLP